MTHSFPTIRDVIAWNLIDPIEPGLTCREVSDSTRYVLIMKRMDEESEDMREFVLQLKKETPQWLEAIKK